MPPPPVTPSPHRFVIKKEPAPVRRTPLSQAHTPRPRPHPRPVNGPNTQQFNTTPRFTFSSTARPSQNPGPTSSAARFSTPGPKVQKVEDAIDPSSDDLPHLHNSIEIDDRDINLKYDDLDNDDGYRLDDRTSKRRKLSSSMIIDGDEEPNLLEEEDAPHGQPTEDSSSLPILSSPPAPVHRRPTSAHPKFLLSTPLRPSTPQIAGTQPTFSKPPRFRPPDPSEASQNTTEPLPDQFSPHRKGHKYVPGGLAAEVRDWLVNIQSSVPARRNKDDPWVVRIVVDEISGGGRAGMTMVRGRQVHAAGDGKGSMVDHLGEVKVILAGEGQGNGVQKGAAAEVGKLIGIKGPVWEVVIEGSKWGVGVDWKVL